jgi:hypothetical protein
MKKKHRDKERQREGMTLFKASMSKDSASSKLPMSIQQTAFPFKIRQVMGYFSEKSWNMRYASCIFEPPCKTNISHNQSHEKISKTKLA